MKKCFIHSEQALVADNQSSKVAEPSQRALDLPPSPVSAQSSTILCARLVSIPSMRCNQLDIPLTQPLAQRIAVIGAVTNDTLRFLTRPPAAMSPAHADRRERLFRETDLVGGRRVKLLSQ